MPDQITVMVNVDFDNDMRAGDVERIVHEVEDEARRNWPEVRRVFTRPMEGAERERKKK